MCLSFKSWIADAGGGGGVVGRDSNTSSSTGTIERVITEETHAGSTGVTVKADPEHPKYEVCH